MLIFIFLLFYAEKILVILIKYNKDVTCICINKTEQNEIQYADDTSLVLDDSAKFQCIKVNFEVKMYS